MGMKFGTFSIVVGNNACNARCDFCVAKMTEQFDLSCKSIDKRIFNVACRLADKADVTTALITSKGEPTLFPDEITDYLDVLHTNRYFPLIELQTNGLVFLQDKDKWAETLKAWEIMGLTTIALSIVHYENSMNQKIYCDDNVGRYRFDYPDLTETINFLVDLGFSIRLNCIGIKGYIDTPQKVRDLLVFVEGTGHELQVTWRPVQMPDESRNDIIAQKTRELEISQPDISYIHHSVELNGTVLYKLPHGATVYDIDGQNFCLSNCLTIQPDLDEIRQLIYVDGHIRYDWQHRGAIIL